MPSDTLDPPIAAPTINAVLGAIAARLKPDIIGTGALAMLRRLDLSANGSLAEPALQRLLANHVPDPWVDRGEVRTWALLIHAMALAAPDRLRFGAGLGAPLFAADYKEGRLVRLLEARVEALAIVVPRAVRFLVAHNQPLDPVALGYFVLGVAAGGERAETQRTRIARDYYHAERAAAS
jgi:hypothetical protein